jgi:enterochelin esterase-like enzyme
MRKKRMLTNRQDPARSWSEINEAVTSMVDAMVAEHRDPRGYVDGYAVATGTLMAMLTDALTRMPAEQQQICLHYIESRRQQSAYNLTVKQLKQT